MKNLTLFIITLFISMLLLLLDLGSFMSMHFLVPTAIILLFLPWFFMLNLNTSKVKLWPLMLVLGAGVSFPLTHWIDITQKSSRKFKAEKVVQSLYNYKAKTGHFPTFLKKDPELANPILYLGLKSMSVSYIKRNQSFVIDYQDGPVEVMQYDSEREKWVSYSEWAGS